MAPTAYVTMTHTDVFAMVDLKIVNKANTLLPVIVTYATRISLSLGFVASLKCLDSPIFFILEM